MVICSFAEKQLWIPHTWISAKVTLASDVAFSAATLVMSKPMSSVSEDEKRWRESVAMYGSLMNMACSLSCGWASKKP